MELCKNLEGVFHFCQSHMSNFKDTRAKKCKFGFNLNVHQYVGSSYQTPQICLITHFRYIYYQFSIKKMRSKISSANVAMLLRPVVLMLKKYVVLVGTTWFHLN